MKHHVYLVNLILLASFILSACGPGQGIVPTSTPLPTRAATETRLPTSTAAPTDTPTPTPTSTITPTPAPDPAQVERMNETVTALVPGEGIQAFATCNLRAAIWGGYDTALTVGSNSTTDRSAHAFSIVSGVFSEELALEDPGSGATYEGNGFVEIEDQETAFKLGLPFFITEVTFEGNSTIHYTVISNPDLSLEGAFATIEQRTDSTYSVTFDRRRAFRSETEPQQFSWTIDDSTAREESYLAIQTAIPGLNNFCLQSNHIKLEDLETSSTSQPSESGAGEIRITTSLGDVILTRAEIAAEDPFGSTAAPGYQIINVYFESADGTEIDGGDFYEESKGASLIGDDGSETNSYTGGLLSGELFVGFTPPASAKSFTLVWPGNDPVELDITR